MQTPNVAIPWRRSLRLRYRTIIVAIIFALSLWYLGNRALFEPVRLNSQEISRRYPLLWEHIGTSHKTGGAWYIPPSWLGSEEQPKTIVEAAKIASRAAQASPDRQMAFSKIPLIVHQTYKSTDVQSWNPLILPFVEKWLTYAMQPNKPMAYLLWDDEGIDELMHGLESDFAESFSLFPRIERTDIFRVLACKWFGGVYGDMDTEPLRPPQAWVGLSDLTSWKDNVTDETYGLNPKQIASLDPTKDQPVGFMGGLEADLDPDTDAYWRMGYRFPVQVTQWALASAPQHPILKSYIATLAKLADDAKDKARKAGENITALEKAYAVERTGPIAFTIAIQDYLEDKIGLRWNSLTGLHDDGKVKLVTDVVILPMTGFSPGRQKSMGSKPVDDVEARLNHHFFGSWRHFSISVESGKLCRTLFGLCRDWSMADA